MKYILQTTRHGQVWYAAEESAGLGYPLTGYRIAAKRFDKVTDARIAARRFLPEHKMAVKEVGQ